MKREDPTKSTLFLLDTNVLSAAIRDPNGKIARRLRHTPKAQLATSIIVSCEMKFGALKRGATVLQERVDAILETLPVHPIDQGIEDTYARTRTEMEKHGHGISAHDLLIACQALLLNATLVTENVRELARVPGLSVESWS